MLFKCRTTSKIPGWKQRSTQTKLQFLLFTVLKFKKSRPFSVSFVLSGDVYEFPRDHATVKFHKPRFSTESLPIILHEIQQ